MFLFEKKSKYSSTTGSKIGFQFVKIGFICDYCGNLIEDPYKDDFEPDLTYKVIESGNIESWFNEMSLFYNNYQDKIDLYDLFNKHNEFVFCQSFETNSFCETKAIQEAYTKFKLKKDPRDLLLVEIIYNSRLNMLQKLFDERKRTLEDFDLQIK